jgi:hypothetical protein
MRSANLTILIVAISGHMVCGQSNISIQPSLNFGKVLEQTNDSNIGLYGFSVDLNKTTSGRRFWQSAHKYPQMGIQFSGTKSTDNSIGNLFMLVPYLEYNLWKSNFGVLQIKHGTGLAFATRPYHETSNPDNKRLGSKLNAASIVDLGYLIKTGTKLDFKAGISLRHISNGNLVQPNAGLNSIMAYGTFSYHLYSKAKEVKKENDSTDFKRWRYRFSTIIGLYDYDKDSKKIHTNYQLSLLAFYQHGIRFRTGFGSEISRLGAAKKGIALYAEEEILIGHLVTRYGIGFYVLNPDATHRLYEKVGIAWYPFALRNHIAEHFSVGTALKAHGFRAAHVEIAVGYTF